MTENSDFDAFFLVFVVVFYSVRCKHKVVYKSVDLY